MGFLYPLFLIAGLAVLLPVLIHLFNLRRYQHVLFPNIRFLQQLQVSSKRAAKIRKKWLLLARILFVAALVLAFARPFINKSGTTVGLSSSIRLIYIDNSMSMTASDGAETLLQKAKKSASDLIQSEDRSAKFIILSNRKMSPGRPVSGADALALIAEIRPVSQAVDVTRILAALRAAKENNPGESWKVYLFSDFQRATFLPEKSKPEVPPSGSEFFFLPFSLPGLSNLYIDTAWIVPGKTRFSGGDRMVVVVKKSGSVDKERAPGRLQIAVDGKMRAVKTMTGFANGAWRDTLGLQLGAGWKQIVLEIDDYPLRFDDTFRIAVQNDPALSVLVTGSDAMSPFLQSAFSSNQVFKASWAPLNTTQTENWNQYDLLILQNIDRLPKSLIEAAGARLAGGGNVLLFPGSDRDKSALNRALGHWGAIRYGDEDTVQQRVVTLFNHQEILRELFTSAPENVQLPVTHQRFPITADITANQQALMSFRDGTPFLAQFRPQSGRLFLVASPLMLSASNFPLSYFFVPVLYRMAIQDRGQMPPSIAMGSQMPLRVSMRGKTNRSVWHLRSGGFDAVPRQTAAGNDQLLFIGATAPHPGFFYLRQETGADSLLIAVNANRREAQVATCTPEQVLDYFKTKEAHWLPQNQIQQHGWQQQPTSFPLWKVCVILALLALALETGLLLSRKTSISQKTETSTP